MLIKGYKMKSVHGGFDGDISIHPEWNADVEAKTASVTIHFYSGGGDAGRFELALPDEFKNVSYSLQREWIDSIRKKISKIVATELKKADEKILVQLYGNIKGIRKAK